MSVDSENPDGFDDDFVVSDSEVAYDSGTYRSSTSSDSSDLSQRDERSSPPPGDALRSSLPLCYCKMDEYIEGVMRCLERFQRTLRNAPRELACGKQGRKEGQPIPHLLHSLDLPRELQEGGEAHIEDAVDSCDGSNRGRGRKRIRVHLKT